VSIPRKHRSQPTGSRYDSVWARTGSPASGDARHAGVLSRGGPPLWIFCTRTGQPFHPRVIQRACAAVLGAAELPAHFTPHCLRHTFASLLLSDGVSPAYVQRMLGHSSIKLTVDLYGDGFRWPTRRLWTASTTRLGAKW
jgi:integrase